MTEFLPVNLPSKLLQIPDYFSLFFRTHRSSEAQKLGQRRIAAFISKMEKLWDQQKKETQDSNMDHIRNYIGMFDAICCFKYVGCHGKKKKLSEETTLDIAFLYVF